MNEATRAVNDYLRKIKSRRARGTYQGKPKKRFGHKKKSISRGDKKSSRHHHSDVSKLLGETCMTNASSKRSTAEKTIHV